jgi:hypothetical protein
MATIIDPLGTPSIVYNKSGTVLIAMDAAGRGIGLGYEGAEAVEIPHVSGHMIVIVTFIDNDNMAVSLPPDANVGDIVEVYSDLHPITVWSPEGQTDKLVSHQLDSSIYRGCRCIKTSGTSWYLIA